MFQVIFQFVVDRVDQPTPRPSCDDEMFLQLTFSVDIFDGKLCNLQQCMQCLFLHLTIVFLCLNLTRATQNLI